MDQGWKTRWKKRRNYQPGPKKEAPSTRRRNAKRMDQWKAKREAIGENTTCVQTQTADINPSQDETTQTDQHNSDAQAINIPTVSTKKKERSTQTRCTYNGSLSKPTNSRTIQHLSIAFLSTTPLQARVRFPIILEYGVCSLLKTLLWLWNVEQQ